MTTTDFSQKVLHRIKEEKITPRSKTYFTLREYFIWFIFGFSLFIGGILVSIDILLIWENYKELQERDPQNIGLLLVAIPYVWLVLTFIFLAVAIRYIRTTRIGYQYRLHWIVAAGFISMMGIGQILYSMEVAKVIENMATRIPYYEYTVYRQADIWARPEEGYYAGTVTAVLWDDTFEITDSWGNSLLMIYENHNLKLGDYIKVIGTTTQNGFVAERVSARSCCGQ